MKLRIKKRSQAEWLIMYIFILPFAFSFLMDMLFFPAFIRYTIDLALVLLLLIMYINKRTLEDSNVTGIMLVVVVFILVTIVGLVLEYQSIIYYLWGMRNNIRFYLFFLLCTIVMKRDDADFCMKLMDSLFYVNAIVALYQGFILNEHQDRIGGIFGTSKGCNGYINIYFIIIVAWHMLRYMNAKETFSKCMSRCGLALVVAAISELKMFFLEFIIITILATFMTKFSIRKCWAIIAAVVSVVVGIEIVTIIFPNYVGWFNLPTIIESAVSNGGYTYTNDFNRLTAITMSWNKFLKTWPQKLFGLGLGNCDYSSNFDFLTTPFYRQNKHFNYVWFSSSFMLLETGLVGLLVYIFFFIQVYKAANTVEKNDAQSQIYCQIAKIMALMAPVLIIYNGSMRMECAYMFYFVLALPFIRQPLEKTKISGDTGK